MGVMFVEHSHFSLLCHPSSQVIHHIPEKKVLGMWKSILRLKLQPGGKVLVVTRPQQDIDYPFFPAATAQWERSARPDGCLVEDLRRAGFEDVQTATRVYPCRIELDRWLDMVSEAL